MFGKTLVRKHTAAFLLLVAVPVSCVILVISFMFRQEAVRIARERTTEAVERSAQALDAEALSFALFTSALVNDGVLQARARAYTSASDPEARYAAARDIEASIAWFFRITSRIGTVILFFDDGGSFVYTNYQTSGIDPEGARALCADPRQPDGEVWCLDDMEVLPTALEKPPVLSMAVRPRPGDAADSSIQAILVSFRIPALDAIASKAAADADAAGEDAREGPRLTPTRQARTRQARTRVMAPSSWRTVRER